MSGRSKDIWNETPVERLLMKLYRVPTGELATLSDEHDVIVTDFTPRKTPKEVRAAARRGLARELAEPVRHSRRF